MKRIIVTLFIITISGYLSSVHAADILRHKISSDWGSGFCYDFILSNTTATTIKNWTIQFSLDANTTITSKWSGNFSQNGVNYTITPASWNKEILPGAQVDIGLCGQGVSRPTHVSSSYEGASVVTPPPVESTGTTTPVPTAILTDYTITEKNLKAAFTTTAQWQGGYCRNVKLTNIGTTMVTDWAMAFRLPQTTTPWSAQFAQSGDMYTVTPVDWTRKIAPNGAVDYGFCTTGNAVDSSAHVTLASTENIVIVTPPNTSTGTTTSGSTNSGITNTGTNTSESTNPTYSGTISYPTGKVFVGYYPTWLRWSYPYNKIDYSKYDIINYAFIFINADGSLNVPNEAIYPELVQEAHRHGKKIVITVGNIYGDISFVNMVSNPIYRSRFLIQLRDFVSTHNYDGVDIDWEFPANMTEAIQYVDLLRDIKNVLGQGKIVSTAVSINYDYIDIVRLSQIVDYVYVMAYDLEGWGGISGYNAPLYQNSKMPIDASMHGFLTTKFYNKNIDRSKFIMGYPLYGKSFQTSAPYQPSGYGTAVLYSDLPAGCVRNWDRESKVPYLSCGSYYVSYDDAQSLSAKLDYTVQNQFGGMFVWAIGQDGGKVISAITR